MKPKTTLILFVVLIAVGVFYWLWGIRGQEQREIRQEMAGRILPMEQESVNQVALIQDGDTTAVYQREGDQWIITSPVRTGADQNAVESNLSAFLEAEKNRTIATELTDLRPYGLDRPNIEVHITYNDTARKVLLVGNENPTGSNVYTKLMESDSIYTSGTNLATEGERTLYDLRDKSILDFEQNAISRVVVSRQNGNDIVMNKVGPNWRMQVPQVAVQSSQVTGMLRSLTNGEAQEFFAEVPDNLDEYGLNTPQYTVSLFSNDTSRVAALQIGEPSEEATSPDYFARDLSRPQIFSVGNSVVQNLQKTPFEFQEKTLFEVSASQVTDVEITWQDTSYRLTKLDTSWNLIRPVSRTAETDIADEIARSIANLRVDSLGSYQQTEPSLYGLDTPWMEASFRISGSEYDGFVVGDDAGNDQRYISIDSSPYVYRINSSRLEDFQVTTNELARDVEADSTDVVME